MWWKYRKRCLELEAELLAAKARIRDLEGARARRNKILVDLKSGKKGKPWFILRDYLSRKAICTMVPGDHQENRATCLRFAKKYFANPVFLFPKK